MDIREFQQELFAEAAKRGFEQSEISYGRSESFQARIFKGAVDEYKITGSFALSFRGVKNGQMGYAYTEKLDEDVIPLLAEQAAANSEVIEEPQPERLFAGSPSYPHMPDVSPVEISAEEKIALALRMEKHALSLDKRVVSVLRCFIGSGVGETGLANSLGLGLSCPSCYGMAYIYVKVEENGQTKVAGEMYKAHDFTDFSPEELAEKAVKKALSYLGAKTMPSGKYPVVFDNTASVDLLDTFINVFYAERVQKGFSMLKSKQDPNGLVACEAVTIRDDGILGNSLGNVPFDSEGVATTSKTVIEKGVLKTLLYNLKSAEKDGVSPTGNGFKPSVKATVSTACTNFYIQPSDQSQNHLLAQMDQGLLITELAGLHSGTNTISGDFSLSADGYWIEGGKISRPVEQITIAGNFYDMLKQILAVGDDLYLNLPDSNGTIGSPSLLVKELSVAGGDESTSEQLNN